MAAIVTAIAGPNLALPTAPGISAFRVVIVLLFAGVLAHLAIGGAIPWPRALSLPASLFGLILLWASRSRSTSPAVAGWADVVHPRWSCPQVVCACFAVGQDGVVPCPTGRSRRPDGGANCTQTAST